MLEFEMPLGATLMAAWRLFYVWSLDQLNGKDLRSNFSFMQRKDNWIKLAPSQKCSVNIYPIKPGLI